MWSKSVFRGLSFYRINLKNNAGRIKIVIVVVDKVLFDEVSRNGGIVTENLDRV